MTWVLMFRIMDGAAEVYADMVDTLDGPRIDNIRVNAESGYGQAMVKSPSGEEIASITRMAARATEEVAVRGNPARRTNATLSAGWSRA